MTVSVMPAVEITGIASQETFHDSGNRRGARLKQNVEMIRDERPPEAESGGLLKDCGKARDKNVSIGIVLENSPTFQSAANDMVKRTRGVYACLSRHAVKVATEKLNGNRILKSTIRSCHIMT